MTALALQNKIIWADPESPLKDLFEEAQNVLLATFGEFSQSFKDFKACYAYHGVGQYDVQHALIAKSLNANELLTFDRGFEDLAKDSHFAQFSFRVL